MNETGSQNRIMEEIQHGEVKMLPKSYFMAKAVLQILGLLIALFLAVFLTSYLLFHLKSSGALWLPSFGLAGAKDLLLSLPWIIVALIVLFGGVLIWFTERFAFAYRRPTMLALLGVALVVLAGGYAVAKTPLHPYFLRRLAPGGALMSGLYAPPMHHAVLGTVVKIENNLWTIETREGEALEVEISEKTHFPNGASCEVGQKVVVNGVAKNGRIPAFGILKINEAELEEFQKELFVPRRHFAPPLPMK